MASIDRLLTASSRIAIRNGDLPVSVSEPLKYRLPRTGAFRRATLALIIQINGPGFPGPFFCALAHCRSYAPSATN